MKKRLYLWFALIIVGIFLAVIPFVTGSLDLGDGTLAEKFVQGAGNGALYTFEDIYMSMPSILEQYKLDVFVPNTISGLYGDIDVGTYAGGSVKVYSSEDLLVYSASFDGLGHNMLVIEIPSSGVYSITVEAHGFNMPHDYWIHAGWIDTHL